MAASVRTFAAEDTRPLKVFFQLECVPGGKGIRDRGGIGEGFSREAALWQVMARVIDQGSRLSAVRLAQVHAAGDVLDMKRGFDENDLYDNLSWLSQNQARFVPNECEGIERKLFEARRGDKKPKLFLYDVTSSYLEGEQNHFDEYGYNRDGKKGKKQVVIGMLCDESGEPVSTKVFGGNTQDPKTFESLVKKVLGRYGCTEVTIVGDRGMIKTTHIERLPEGFHYITAITRPQIESLIKKGVLQLGLFEEKLCEIKEEGVRYILRRNPIRAEEMAKTRISKLQGIERCIEGRNVPWLSERASEGVGIEGAGGGKGKAQETEAGGVGADKGGVRGAEDRER